MALDPPHGRPQDSDADDDVAAGASSGSAAVAALSVYVEPLVADARVGVIGDVELGLHERFLELGARTVHLFDPDPERVARNADEVPRGVSVRMLRDDFDVRDGAFDLVVIPDLGILPDPSSAVVRLRRVIDPRGAVVAMGRARMEKQDGDRGADGDDQERFPELAPAVVEYAELYDLFALQFESVTMTGVLPFAGVVFAELGAGDDLAVSVDTRLVDPEPPSVFVVVAGRESSALDPYAIVQVASAFEAQSAATDDEDEDEDEDEVDVESLDTIAIEVPILTESHTREIARRDHEVATAFAAMQLKAELLAAQLDEHRARLAAVDDVSRRAAEKAVHIEQIARERDSALARASELEGVLVAAQQALGGLERRLVAAEQGMLERDDQIAALNAELDARTSGRAPHQELTTNAADPAQIADLLARAERAETSLALHVADLAQLSEAQAAETHALEEQLRDRARVIAAMDKELARREQLVRELVFSLEEARDNAALAGGAGHVFEAAPAMPGVAPEEVARLRRKLDDLALEVARREGELVAQAWRITELENEKTRLLAARAADAARAQAPAPPAPARAQARSASATDLEGELARTRDELDALRQALTQEHSARVAAESGEELARARAELARQAALLEQIKGRGTHPEG